MSLSTSHAAGQPILAADINDIAAAVNGAAPVADPAATVDETTYDNTLVGSGKLRTIVVPADTTVLAIAVEGDAFPRIVVNADPTDYAAIMLGDGTIDPVDDGCSIGYNAPGDITVFARAGRNTVVGSLAANIGISAPQIGLGVTPATTLGTVVGKVEVFDLLGVSAGFIPVYNTIT